MKKLLKQEFLIGKHVNLREVNIDDAIFILKLRTDEKKSRFLHKTENNLQKQIDYLKKYKTLDDQWYFIIENKQKKPVGTIRIYDVHGTTFTHGSWLVTDEANPVEAIEGEMLCKQYAFEVLGMDLLYFDVRKQNIKVVNYHKSWGSKIVSENELDYFFELTKNEFEKNKQKFEKWL